MQATNLVQETPQTTNKAAKKKMIEEETSTKTPQTWTLDSHQNQSSNFVKSLYKYGVSNGRQSTQSFNPKHNLLFDLQTLIYLFLVMKKLLRNWTSMKKLFLSFFLSVQPPSILSSMSWWLLINHYGWKMGALYLVLDHKYF
jgi:hypothetical protein